MPKHCYRKTRFHPATLKMIGVANTILEDLSAQGYDITLRQLYYQLVGKGLIPNTEKSYKKLGKVINDARLSGLVDWNHIIDQTRNVRSLSTWNGPEDIIKSAAASFRLDKWKDQDCRLEVWVEKDALMNVVSHACNPWQVDYFSCRGYTSQSEMWGASQRLLHYIGKGKEVVIIHLGDHDPSGVDMSRDIEDRLDMFLGGSRTGGVPFRSNLVTIKRIALNMNQVKQYKLVPNPAKLTDSRCAEYVKEHGNSSWELDALDPRTIDDLIQTTIQGYIDYGPWTKIVNQEKKDLKVMDWAVAEWPAIREAFEDEQVEKGIRL